MADLGTALPELFTSIPGPNSKQYVDRLAEHECPAITARRARRADELGTVSDDPIVWRRAVGSNVIDVDGNRFVDLTSGFAVALLGHRDPQVVSAAKAQSDTCVHAMGDAFPDATRIDLLAEIARIAPGDLSVSLLGLSGSDAVDAAVKTAMLATKRPGVLTFDGGYHGLALGVLGLQGYKSAFTEPFSEITHPHAHRLPYGAPMAEVQQMLHTHNIGLVLVEPLQGRGGMRCAPEGWLEQLLSHSRQAGCLVAFDEIQSGMGRTGRWFACEHSDLVPDLLCVGKALGGGFPISACVGSKQTMSAWHQSNGEAIHTQTFLGHPVGCAAALASIRMIETKFSAIQSLSELIERYAAKHKLALRGRGLMRGLEIEADALVVTRKLMARGYLVLPAGPTSLALTPAVTCTEAQLSGFFNALESSRQ